MYDTWRGGDGRVDESCSTEIIGQCGDLTLEHKGRGGRLTKYKVTLLLVTSDD